MKKKFTSLFIILLTAIILCAQLPLGFITGAVDPEEDVPTEYPPRTVLELNANLDFQGMTPKAEDSETEFSQSVDFTSADYDYFEFDMLIIPSANFSGRVQIALFDADGSIATHSFNIASNRWTDIKIATDDFEAEGIDMKNVVGYRINNPEPWIQYQCINLCLTGIKRPEEIPTGNIDYLAERIDLVDNDKNSANSRIFAFDDIDTVDILSKDFIEFDIYVLNTIEESIYVSPTVAFTDIDCNSDSKFGSNTASYKLHIKTDSWNHIKIPVTYLKVKDCKTDKISGVRIMGTENGYRYVLCNLLLKTASVDAPKIPDDAASKPAEGILENYFSTDNGTALEYHEFESFADISKNEHVVVDVYCASVTDDVQNLKLNLKDAAGKTASYDIVVKPEEWVNVKVFVKAFEAEDGFDFTKVAAVNISELYKDTRYFLANFYLTDTNIDIKDGYPYNAVKTFDDVKIDYYTAVSNNVPADTTTPLGETCNLENYDYVEFDIYIDTPLDSTVLPESMDLYFVDTSGRKILGRRACSYNSVQHVRMLVAALSSGGDKKNVASILLDNVIANSRYVIKNFCFTKITAPAAPTKDVVDLGKDSNFLVKWSDVTIRYNEFYDNDVTFDDLPDIRYQQQMPDGSSRTMYSPEGEAYDATKADYLEFDAYLVCDESDPKYTPVLDTNFKLCNRDYDFFASENGRGTAPFSVNTNEWTHIRIPIANFASQTATAFDPSTICRFFIDGNLRGKRMIIANMCLGKRAALAFDKDKPAMPDKDARYVSDCDSANTSEVGIWSSSNTYFSTDYKTEGKGAAFLQVTNRETAAMNSHRFLFAAPADLSASKSIRFDLFVDDLDLVKTCDFKVYLSSDTRNSRDNFIYNIKASTFKLGWNSFDIPLSSFKKEDSKQSADWSSIQSFAIEVTLNTPFAVYGPYQDYFLFGLDNIRIAKTFDIDLGNPVIDEPQSGGNTGNNNSSVNNQKPTLPITRKRR